MFRKGFTLIELIVVIAIIAILAAVVAPSAFKSVEKAKIAGTAGDWKSVKTGSMAYFSDVGDWPANCSGSAACQATGFFNNTGVAGWDGPYLDKWPNGRWGAGTVSWTTTTSDSTYGPGTVGARWITVTNVSSSDAANKVDLTLDGGTAANYTSGQCRWSNTTNNMTIIISRDGQIN
jgi:general secretion pathway protein G